ncbi:hypothetical protein GALL_410780 [mine drainage metagenome]|uniref:Chemoreceptor zinc-binding domain-containing protein n=1 Tax=mine drainage metagenome TaxID=410659 RepID=A0A1J5Q1P9_9ZZZZ
MINKKLALNQVLKAKASHLKWLSYARGMVDGIDCPLDSVPIQSTECAFGKWYYGEGREMLAELALFQALEPPHEILHSLYRKIYDLVQQCQMDEARKHMPGFLEVSRNLLETIAFLEQEIKDLPPNN